MAQDAFEAAVENGCHHPHALKTIANLAPFDIESTTERIFDGADLDIDLDILWAVARLGVSKRLIIRCFIALKGFWSVSEMVEARKVGITDFSFALKLCSDLHEDQIVPLVRLLRNWGETDVEAVAAAMRKGFEPRVLAELGRLKAQIARNREYMLQSSVLPSDVVAVWPPEL